MNLKDYSIEELKDFIEEAKNLIKEKKNNINETNREILLRVNEGRKILVLFKGEPTLVKFVGVTNSRFTVELGDSKKSILFDKLISTEPEF